MAQLAKRLNEAEGAASGPASDAPSRRQLFLCRRGSGASGFFHRPEGASPTR